MKSAYLALALAWILLAGCGSPSESGPTSEGAAAPTPSRATAEATPAQAEPARASARPRGRPLPAFSALTLDDRRIDISEYVGRRLVLFFFNPEVRTTLAASEAVNAIAPLRGDHNFAIVGIATGSDRKTARDFVAERGIDFPVIDDSNAQLARRFGLRDPLAVVGVDSEGYVAFGMTGFAEADAQAIQANLRASLRLPEDGGGGSGRIQAPSFSASVLGDDKPFDLAAHRGEPVVLIFFLHTCPHCHSALRFLRDALAEIPENQRPLLVGLEISGRTYAVREMLKNEALDFFPVLFDEGGTVTDDYGVFAGVPDIFLIDAESRIAQRFQGWYGESQEPLVRMWLNKLAGVPVPMLLRTNGYSGSEVCGVCHEMEHETWTFTSHASAFDTLVKHAADHDAECIGCHVVGHENTGGFLSAEETPNLEDVGCESCHGRGGPHLSPGFVGGAGYAEVCAGCHDAKHSLGFEFAAFRPRISHLENASLIELPPQEKQRILAERGRPGGSLLPTRAAYVGSESCRSCHGAEFETWAGSPHARAGKTLEAKGHADDADCLRCHTTGFDRPGGFAASAALAGHPDLARVGCESCHGPGGDHVAEGATRIGTILSLGDKCDSCVILQICGSCHDDANDPGFEFEVQEKIERQRHGTIEPGTGRPVGATARALPGDAELLARAFALADGEAAWTGR